MEDMNQQQGAPMQQPPQPEEHASVGAAIGIIVVIIILVLGGLYFWGAELSKQGYDPKNDEEVQSLQDTNESDELGAIEADLSEDFDTLDKELEELDQELQTI